MIVIIAEKTSQANKIASALGFTKTSGVYKGNFEGKEAVLWAAAGHLVELSPPSAQMANFSWNDPLTHLNIPRHVPYQICPDIKGTNGYPDRKPGERVTLLKHYLKEATLVIGATDPDREGEVIYRSILEYAGYIGPLDRVWLSNGLGVQAIIDSFNSRTSASQFIGEYYAGIGRRMADYGSMVLTTTYTYYARKGMLGAHLGIGEKAASTCSVGRVQSTTLGFTYLTHMKRKNFSTIQHFKIKPIFSFLGNQDIHGKYLPTINDDQLGNPVEGIHWKEADFSSSISAEMTDDEIELLSKKNTPSPLYISENNIAAFKVRILKAKILDVDVTESVSVTPPPKPLSMTRLQSLLSHATANSILDAAQDLYLAGIINYPRSEESEFNDKDFNPRKLSDLCSQLAKWEKFGQQALAVKAIQDSSIANGTTFKPKAYTKTDKSHEALSPVVVPPPGKLSGLQLEVFEKITEHYLLAHLPSSTYHCQNAKILVDAKGLFGESTSRFELNSKACIEPGWKLNEPVITNPMAISELSAEEWCLDDVTITEHKTAPPSLYNETSLLFAMYHAAKFEPDPVLRASLKNAKGIGTAATRPGNIETLLKRGYIAHTNESKSMTLDITSKGIDLYNALPKSFKSAGTTAKWELELNKIAQMGGDEAKEQTEVFINTQLTNIENLIEYLNTQLLAKTPKRGVHPRLPLTPKTSQMLQKRCKGLGLPLPRKVLHSEAMTRKWLDDNPWVITEAMKRKIKQIEVHLKVVAPIDCHNDFGKAMDFIKANESKVPATPAQGSIDYAKMLAKTTGLQIPKAALSDARILNEFINQAKNIRAVPKKLLIQISQLAKQHNVRVSTSEINSIESAKRILSRLNRLG